MEFQGLPYENELNGTLDFGLAEGEYLARIAPGKHRLQNLSTLTANSSIYENFIETVSFAGTFPSFRTITSGFSSEISE